MKLFLSQRYSIMWQGLLALKNDSAACQMHFVSGNIAVARDSLPSNPDGSIPPLRISQRMQVSDFFTFVVIFNLVTHGHANLNPLNVLLDGS
jgi:hypothetical protein